MSAVLTDLTVKRLAGSLGAEVSGISLANPQPHDIQTIRQLLLTHLVLFFPGQNLSVDEHVAFGANFGELEAHPNLNNPFTQHPQIFELAASHGGLADEWHSDITFEKHPSIMSILNMVQSPEVGGDTMWASAYAAYEGLSAPLRDLCDGLTALHDAAPHGRPEQTWIHPVVRKHPETGRKSLFVNEHFTRRIVELSHVESEMLLNYLVKWVSSPSFTVRYSWEAGTIAMWDNRCTQHYVLSDFSEQRIIQRVTIMGDTPEAACPPRWESYVRPTLVGATSRFDKQLNKHLGKKIKFLEDNAD
ncbi:MAG: TauD/TfdA family dioxygenase [Burkholderiaceae bacterium]